MRLRPVEIVGGGLAGLSLGLALRAKGIPVVLYEAGNYPKRRVCGEFITGLEPETIAKTQLGPSLARAGSISEVTWHFAGGRTATDRLPQAAFCLSRYYLDADLARRFVEAGGQLETGRRIAETSASGRIYCTGRRPARSEWLGMSVHVRDGPFSEALEVYLGSEAYVGVCPVEDGEVNVCGLFHRPKHAQVPKEQRLEACLREAGLKELASVLQQSTRVPESFCAVGGLSYSASVDQSGPLRIGDAAALIAPFTGNGMAMAIQGAALACDPLAAWSCGDLDWIACGGQIRRDLRRRFHRRLAAATVFHPFLTARWGQACFRAVRSLSRLSFASCYALSH